MLIVMFFCVSSSLFARQTIWLNDDEASYPVNKDLYYFKDKSGDLTIHQVISLSENDSFTLNEAGIPNFGMTRGVYWFCFDLKNDSYETDWFLEIDYSTLNDVRLYLADSTGKVVKKESGGLDYNRNRLNIEHRVPLFLLDMDPGGEYRVFFRIQTVSALIVPLRIYSSRGFLNADKSNRELVFILFGIVLFAALFNLVLFFVAHETGYLYLSLFLFFISGQFIFMYGYGFEYFTFNDVYWKTAIRFIAFSIGSVFLVLFTITYLDLTQFVWLNRIFKGLIIYFIIYTILPVLRIIPLLTINKISSISYFTGVFLFIYAGIHSLIKGNKQAVYYLLSFMVFIIATVLYNGMTMGIFKANIFIQHTSLIATAFFSMLLTVGVSEKVAVVRKERARAEQLESDNILLEAEIFERILAERVLKESEERFKTISGLSFEAIILHENGVVSEINKAFTMIFGYTREEVIGKNIIELAIPQKHRNTIRKNVQKDYTLPYSVEAIKKDGSIIPVEIESRSFYYQGKQLRVASVRDITNRNRIEESLLVALHLNEIIISHTEEEIIEEGLQETVRISQSKYGYFFIIDEEEKVARLAARTGETGFFDDQVWQNRAVSIGELDIWAEGYYSRHAVIDNNYKSYADMEISNGQLYTDTFTVSRYVSIPVIEDNSIKALLGVGNKLSEYTAIDVDQLSLLAENILSVSRRKHAEESLKYSETRLKELNATKDRFFSIISHDLRGPVSSLIDLSRLIIEQYPRFNDNEKMTMMEHILQNSNNTLKLLDNLLIWSQSQTGRISYKPQSLKISDLVSESISLLKDQAEKKEINISNQITGDLLVNADREMIKTVVRNLISNSIKFTGIKGKIAIRGEESGNSQGSVEYIKICVWDNGTGIEKEKLGKLFRIDQDISTRGTRNETGTGLGLILCKEFVEKNRGRIYVKSKAGKGSEFCFTLPAGKPPLK